MTQYRKKPVVIEAFQMTEERRWDNSEWPQWLHEAWQPESQAFPKRGISKPGTIRVDPEAPVEEGRSSASLLVCDTVNGPCEIAWDDWIIEDPLGNLSLCKPDIFAATYEAVEEEESNA